MAVPCSVKVKHCCGRAWPRTTDDVVRHCRRGTSKPNEARQPRFEVNLSQGQCYMNTTWLNLLWPRLPPSRNGSDSATPASVLRQRRYLVTTRLCWPPSTEASTEPSRPQSAPLIDRQHDSPLGGNPMRWLAAFMIRYATLPYKGPHLGVLSFLFLWIVWRNPN